ncbi:MAG: hypothetical protein ACOH17_04340 [Cellulomonas sp.]
MSESPNGPVGPVPDACVLTGSEPFVGMEGTTVLDFWRWGMSDLRANTLRGVVAEYLVTRALGAASGCRVEWAAYDVVTRDGIRVEVKCAAYLQAWPQHRLSRITFSGLSARLLDEGLGNYTGERAYNADVYVFAVQTAISHDVFDVLDTGQWDFYVVSRAAVAATGYRSLSLAAVRALAGPPVGISELGVAVVRAHGNVSEPE